MAGYWSSQIGLRVSGMVFDRLSGMQLNISYKLFDSQNILHNIGIALGGLSYQEYSNNVEKTKWTYFGIVYNLNCGGFFFESGLSIGEGDFTNPQAIFQIGYMYRGINFDKKRQKRGRI